MMSRDFWVDSAPASRYLRGDSKASICQFVINRSFEVGLAAFTTFLLGISTQRSGEVIQQHCTEIALAKIFTPKAAKEIHAISGTRSGDVKPLLVHLARKRTDRLCVRDHGDENNVSFSSLKRHCITTSDLMLHDFLFSELGDELLENKVSLLSSEKRNDSDRATGECRIFRQCLDFIDYCPRFDPIYLRGPASAVTSPNKNIHQRRHNPFCCGWNP